MKSLIMRALITLALLWAMCGFFALTFAVYWLGTRVLGEYGFLVLPIGIFVAGAWYLAGAMLEDFWSKHD